MDRIGTWSLIIKFILLALLCTGPCFAQGGTVSNVRYGPTLPALCTPNTGALFSLTTGTAGLYQCLVTNTWSLVGAAVSSGLTPNNVVKAVSSTTIGNGSMSDDGTNPVTTPNGMNILTTGGYDFEVPNNTSTGTTLATLACDDGAGAVIVCPHTSSTTNQSLGVVITGAGTAGNVTLCNTGFCSVKFDNSATAEDYAIASTTIDGYLHDAGATLTAGQPNYFIWTSNSGSGTAGLIRLLIGDDFANSSNTGVTTTGSPTNGQIAEFSGAKTITGVTLTPGFNTISSGTNTSAAMLVGSGATLGYTGKVH